MTNRRDFLKLSSLASASLLMPQFLQGVAAHRLGRPDRKLVVIQQSGGNDGLNTFVPYRNDDYYRVRPRLAIAPEEVLRLNDEMGLNPQLGALRELYDQGWLSLVNSVGYPNPDRSHFRSMDIWHTGSNSDEYWESGWLGRYLDHTCQGSEATHQVVEIDDTLSLAVKGQDKKALGVRNPKSLYQATQDRWIKELNQHEVSAPASDLAYMYKTLTETSQSAAYIYEKSRVYRSKVEYPTNPLARDLKLVAELINSGVETSVFYVSLSGFDTHVRQRNPHDRLLQNYGNALAAFVKDLKQQGHLDQTLILTFSEFGRRVKENASGGTDHGKANSLTLIGGQLKQAGVYNAAPQLNQLDDGDVPYAVDFREVYADLLRNWLKVDDQAILQRNFKGLNLV
ncbi:MAG: DUF1501 domain-containing protein [Bacteroidota bacterium]